MEIERYIFQYFVSGQSMLSIDTIVANILWWACISIDTTPRLFPHIHTVYSDLLSNVIFCAAGMPDVHLSGDHHQYGTSAWCIVMSSNTGVWNSVKEGCNVVCLNKAVGIVGAKCVALSAVL